MGEQFQIQKQLKILNLKIIYSPAGESYSKLKSNPSEESAEGVQRN